MPPLLDLIAQAQALKLAPNSPAQKFVEDALNAVLLAEGPPSQPIDDFSENLRTDIARSSHGRVRFLAHSWNTGPWTCLLLDLHPVPMGRPQLLADKATGTHRVTVDYPSRKMQQQIRFACSSLGLPPPPEPSRFVTAFAPHRTFIAWTGHSEQINTLKGDLDNYAKNVLDGFQRAGLIRNDKSVASLLAVNSPMPEPVRSLEDFMGEKVSLHLQKHPGDTPKRTAKALNYPVQRTERLYRDLKDTIQALRLDRIHQVLKKHPNAKLPEIAKKTGLALSVVSLLLPKLEIPAFHAPAPSITPSMTPPTPKNAQGAGPGALANISNISNITQDLVSPKAPGADNTSALPISFPLDKSLDSSNPDLLEASPDLSLSP